MFVVVYEVQRKPSVENRSMRLSVCDVGSQTKPCQIFVKFATEFSVYKGVKKTSILGKTDSVIVMV